MISTGFALEKIVAAVSYLQTANDVWTLYQEAFKDYSPAFNQLTSHINSTKKTVKRLREIPSSIKGVLDKAFADYAKLVEGLGKITKDDIRAVREISQTIDSCMIELHFYPNQLQDKFH
jgi:hypothetical protein